jgi:uncharacterized protein
MGESNVEFASGAGGIDLSAIKPIEERELAEIYEPPFPMITQSVTSFLHDHHIAYLKVARFFCVATGDDTGIAVSPRGNERGAIHVLDRHTIAWPEWNGNNRILTLHHLTKDRRIGLLFLFPGLNVFMRLNGKAIVTRNSEIRRQFEHNLLQPRVVIVMHVDRAFFHCGRASLRSALWDSGSHITPGTVPTAGTVLKDLVSISSMSAEQLDALYDTKLSELYTG